MPRAPLDFEAIFAAMPGPCMVLDRDFMIVGANEAYLAITGLSRDQLEGRFVFDVFPDNPNDPQTTAVANSSASYDRVLQMKRADVMAVQRQDIRLPVKTDGGEHQNRFEEHHWQPVNIPVLDSVGQVRWILNCVEDVTEAYRLRRRLHVGSGFTPERRKIIGQLRDESPILRGLDNRLFDLLAEHLTPVSLASGQVLVEAFQPVKAAYFLLHGLASITREMTDGSTAGVAAAGPVGMVGESLLFGADTPSTETRMQIAGSGLKLDADILRILMAENPALRPALARSAVPALLAMATITAACNANHSLEQRLSRLLLSAHDWVESPDLQVGQDSLAIMLGVRRTGISETLAQMSRAGILVTGRNRIKIINLHQLELRSCDCYRDLHSEFVRLGVTTTPGHRTSAARVQALFHQYFNAGGDDKATDSGRSTPG